ncbi:unnamed protein product [Arabis nemorensis]|uniref:F-box domain-containing protein n=1 Tax=Arabis nemorensis TaxID=586526 RepID=A0A565B670_9BRAS|nr:unnamed protein product [Arabis nemorensis]
MNRDILSNIFKKLDVVDVIMGASRVCITWFLASHDRTIWNTIKLNDPDSILLDYPHGQHMQDNDGEKQQEYPLRKILVELNKFGRTVPINFFFNMRCNILDEDLAIISKRMPNIRKLALPIMKPLDLNSIQSAFSKWKNLETLIISPFTLHDNAFIPELKTIGDNCRNLTTMKFHCSLYKDLAKILVCNFPSLERLSFRCGCVCRESTISLIIGHPNLKILNLSHCIFTQLQRDGGNLVSGMKPKEELLKTGTQKLEKFMLCCPEDCTICQDTWKYTISPPRHKPEFHNFWEKQWKTDEIKDFEF